MALEPSTLNGLTINNQYICWINRHVQERLYDLDPSSTALIPRLADGQPKVIDDLTTEVKIRPGIKFHNGDELTAEDVAATINAGNVKGKVWVFHLAPLVKAEAVDATTVRFTFKNKWALLPSKLALIPIIHRKYLDRDDAMMGTGPYKLQSHQPGVDVKLTANTDYRDGAPKISGIVYRFVPESGARLVNLVQGSSTVYPAVTTIDAPRISSDGNLVLAEAAAPVLITMRPNCAHPALRDERVRQALAFAINRKRMRDVVFGGRAEIGQGPIGPGHEGWEYITKVYGENPDLDRARSLLAAAGYQGKQINFTWVAQDDSVLRDVGAVLKADWAEVGLVAELQFLQQGDWLTSTAKGGPWGFKIAFEMAGTGQGRSIDGSVGSLMADSTSNSTSFIDEESTAIAKQAEVTADATERIKLYAKWSDMLATKAAYIPPVYPSFLIGHRKELTGLDPAAYRINAFDLSKASLR
ncbi:ABC transporter substrate-binding protein [Dactylosporangium sp. CA-092794]|uniref:ABC transporter substrate-binding protein n=1 Tax=Dactylosporangium sp. CA-092794 TaxID=3239929 RepID=UPI003D8D0602